MKSLFWHKLRGTLVGQDALGNAYFEEKSLIARLKGHSNLKRWVVYQGINEASKVCPEWHGWLHYTIENPPSEVTTSYSWQKSHQPNMTGTTSAYLPKSHPLKSKQSSDKHYKSWEPQ